MSYQGQRSYNGGTARHGDQKSIYVPITGFFTNKSGNGLSVMVTDSVIANLGNIAAGDKLVFFTNDKAEKGKPNASLKLIKAADLTQPDKK
jgi:hypothetical protein